MKRNRILASMGLAVMGMGLATPVLAADWRVCVVGACLKAGGCGDREATVAVSMPTDVTDEEVHGTDGLVDALMRYITANGSRAINGQPMVSCTPSQPDEDAARKIALNIASEMSSTFYEVTFRSPNDMFPGYQQRDHQ